MRIYNNPAAFNTWRNLQITDAAISKDLEKLSSGLRINRAADDASGLAQSEKMRNQIDGLKQASANAQDGISLIQSAEGALDVIHEMMRRVRTLALKGNNDSLVAEDRLYIANEIDQLYAEFAAIIGEPHATNPVDEDFQPNGRAEFNTRALFQSTGGLGGSPMENLHFQIGANINQTMDLAAVQDELDAIRTLVTDSTIELNGEEIALADIFDGAFSDAIREDGTYDETFNSANDNPVNTDFEGNESFRLLVQGMDAAISTVSSLRAKLGAYQNRLEYTVRNLNTITENTIIAESRVRDTDMASQMSSFTKNNILLQSGTAMLAQANQKPQSVLRLLG